MIDPGAEASQVLIEASANAEAAEAMVPHVYRELRSIAAAHLARERLGHTLQPTALVHEAYLRLADRREHAWRSRAHFLAAATVCIRRILIESARRRAARKRGGTWTRVELDSIGADVDGTLEFLDLDDALNELAGVDPRAARVVELRCFGGMEVAATAEVLGVSPATVERDWSTARAWLVARLRGSDLG